MSDLKPLPSWVPPEMEPEHREWQAQLDDYIKHWSAEVGKFLEEKGYRRRRTPQPR